MTEGKRLNWTAIWSRLGDEIRNGIPAIELAKVKSRQNNPWFTTEHMDFAIESIIHQFFDNSKLQSWIEKYQIGYKPETRVGVICAGNIPLVGWHDIMSVLTSGCHARIKLSNKDQFLIPAFLNEMVKLFPETASCFSIVDKLTDYDAVIATGSDNSTRYFKSYFGHVPHVFRSNRTGVGILSGEESTETIEHFCDDIFIHFGLGCRNISKLYIAESFELDKLFKASLKYSSYLLNSKYKNNYIYHTSLFQMNKVDHLTNDLMIMLESEQLHAPLSVVYYERFNSINTVIDKLKIQKDNIQVVYCEDELEDENLTFQKPGTGQKPQLWDYADGVDVMHWLNTELK